MYNFTVSPGLAVYSTAGNTSTLVKDLENHDSVLDVSQTLALFVGRGERKTRVRVDRNYSYVSVVASQVSSLKISTPF